MKAQEFISLIMDGKQFEYLTYDFKKAKECLLNENRIISNDLDYWEDKELSEIMPQAIKDKFSKWQKGKVWEIRLNYKGEIHSFRIGKNRKYSKIIYFMDVDNQIKIEQ